MYLLLAEHCSFSNGTKSGTRTKKYLIDTISIAHTTTASFRSERKKKWPWLKSRRSQGASDPVVCTMMAVMEVRQNRCRSQYVALFRDTCVWLWVDGDLLRLQMLSVPSQAVHMHHLAFFKAHSHHTVHEPLVFRLHPNATAVAKIEPASFGAPAEHHN